MTQPSLAFVAGGGAPGQTGPVSDTDTDTGVHPGEAHTENAATRLNWLRAGVLGANDGIVSTAGLVAGVAGATDSSTAIVTAGLAGLVAGALSMAAGEYVSVSTQRDSEKALIAKEERELAEMPEEELDELTDLLAAKGIDHALAREVAVQLTEHDALAAHAEVELGLDPNEFTNPWHAAWASMVAFTLGALVPLLVIAFSPDSWRVPITMLVVALALAVTGAASARLGQSPVGRAVVRNVAGGLVAMAVTWGVGQLFGTTVG